MGDLVPVGEVIDGEIVDDLCGCGKPGELMPDPIAAEYGETELMELCPACAQQRADDA